MVYITRISIFKKPTKNLYLGGFWGEKSRGANGFWMWQFLTLTAPLVKIGGQRLILESYQYAVMSVTPFRLNIFSKLILSHFSFFTRPVLHYRRGRPRTKNSGTKNSTGTMTSEGGTFRYFKDVGVPGRVRGYPRTARFSKNEDPGRGRPR